MARITVGYDVLTLLYFRGQKCLTLVTRLKNGLVKVRCTKAVRKLIEIALSEGAVNGNGPRMTSAFLSIAGA